MRLGLPRTAVQHLGLAMTLFGARLAPVWMFFPCLTCSLVGGGCQGCLLRFAQMFAAFLAGPVSFGSLEGRSYFLSITVLALMVVVFGRTWCGWLCPFGLLQEYLRRLGSLLGVRRGRLSPASLRALSAVRLLLLAVLLVVPPLVELGLLHPDFIYAYCRICPAGTMMTLLTGHTERLALNLSSSVSAALSVLSLALLGSVAAMALAHPRPWCRVCPVSLLFGLFHKKTLAGLRADPGACLGCGRCRKVCPVEEAAPVLRKNPGSGCLLCGRCLDACPVDGCLAMTFGGGTVAAGGKRKN
ncbi:MAG: 4Fe-4S binding protein [Deltaproteobacteria bacterium]|jgi:polyferredoxin|nr:4Fe-4S binding protein [Deltaproteobacteria bacterium]